MHSRRNATVLEQISPTNSGKPVKTEVNCFAEIYESTWNITTPQPLNYKQTYQNEITFQAGFSKV
jgi:hypothetical protein